MTLGIFEASLNIVQEAFGDLFSDTNGKSYREIETIFCCSRGAAFPMCKKFLKSRFVKNLLRVGRP